MIHKCFLLSHRADILWCIIGTESRYPETDYSISPLYNLTTASHVIKINTYCIPFPEQSIWKLLQASQAVKENGNLVTTVIVKLVTLVYAVLYTPWVLLNVIHVKNEYTTKEKIPQFRFCFPLLPHIICLLYMNIRVQHVSSVNSPTDFKWPETGPSSANSVTEAEDSK